MARWRRSVLVRSVVMVLLLWTGADLTNASLCALEEEQNTPFSTSDPGATLEAPYNARLPLAPEPPHIDDCFCCSHCVEVQDLAPGLVSEPVSGDLSDQALASPRTFGVRLYHPPLV